MGILFLPLIIVATIALIFGLGPVILLIECAFSSETRKEFFKDGEWKEATILSIIGWVVFAICLWLILSLPQ